MELRPNLFAQAKQSLAITPRVIQSIKLLKYDHEELCAYLKEQEERNPLIEVVFPEILSNRSGVEASKTRPERVATTGGQADGVASVASGYDLRSIEETQEAALTLREHLLHQVELNICGQSDKLIAREIVESIEPDGYLRRSIEDIAECLGGTVVRISTVLGMVQKFEPAGVGARSLSECLRLQLQEANELTPAMAVLLDNLETLAKLDLPVLARICQVDQQEVAAMARRIRKLDPRPGKRFDTGVLLPAMPDVTVELLSDGTTHVELNSALLPKVLVNREYYAEMRTVASAEDDVRFVTDCMKDANWLTRNLDQRANTLLNVAAEIVRRQRDFFLHGIEHIKPLCQGDVADAIGLHRSTVCRAISGKHMMTNRGLFELKYFFSNALASAGGDEDVSAESIRARIQGLIDGEGSDKVLSDDAIMEALRDTGIEIARRTVAKYREMLGIPSSAVRRRRRHVAKVEAELCLAN